LATVVPHHLLACRMGSLLPIRQAEPVPVASWRAERLRRLVDGIGARMAESATAYDQPPRRQPPGAAFLFLATCGSTVSITQLVAERV
jgi:hypothetical protein